MEELDIDRILAGLKYINKELDEWDLYDPSPTHWDNIEDKVYDLIEYLEFVKEGK
jgi:hypothetical protein